MQQQAFLAFLALTAMTVSGAGGCSPKNPNAAATTTSPWEADLRANAASAASGATASSAATAMPDDKSRSFVERVVLTDMYEIEESKLALTRSSSGPVKAFARIMIDDHTSTSRDLAPLAKAAGVSPPVALDDDHLKKIEDLRKMTDKEFDTKYLNHQQDAHATALGVMKDYAQNGTDAGLQSFATKVAGKVGERLQKAKALDKNGADDTAKKS